MKVISLYSGADNLGDGVIQAGHEVIMAVEYNPKKPSLSIDACKTIKLNHPDCEVIHKPVSEVLSTLPKCDAVIGGPPCPEFSRAKTDRTFDLCEVNNFNRAVEICKAKYYLMENVQDLAKVHKERNFLINCADYGVPQTRIRRIFTNLRLPQCSHAEFPSNTLFGEPLKKWVSVKDALGLEGVIEDRKTTFGEYYKKDDGKFREYSTNKPSNSLVVDSRQFYISPTGFHSSANQKILSRPIEDPAPTVVNANEIQLTDHKIYSLKYLKNKNPIMFKKHKPTEITNPMNTIITADKNTSQFIYSTEALKRKNPEIFKKHPPNTLDGQFATIKTKDRAIPDEMISDGTYARKLTNKELAILQGFRLDFKFFGTKTSVRVQIGNALPSAISKSFFSKENLN